MGNKKKEKKKMTRDVIPQDFTLALVIVDAIPVLFFSATMLVVGLLFMSPLFILGAALVLFAGAVKVLWKLFVVLQQKNIWWMFLQMRILMPIGMVMMLASLVIDAKRLNGSAVWAAVTTMPSAALFLVGVVGMVLMTVFAFTLDAEDVRSNWIEQITNAVAQAAIFLGVLMLL